MDITYKQYFYLLILAILTMLGSVALINYKIDPANIYQDIRERESESSRQYAITLVKSTNGLLWPNNSWNERDIKSALSKLDVMNIDCAIIGSSHVMQISSFRHYKSLETVCPRLVNLGLSGGTLEDYLALSYMLVNNKNRPGTIVFGIDPWALDFHSDSRWQKYKESYYKMTAKLNNVVVTDNNKHNDGGSARDDGISLEYIVNLINPQYFYRSLQSMGKAKYNIVEAPEFNYSEGMQDPVLLPDGSHIYSEEYIAESRSAIVPIGGANYKIKENGQYSSAAVNLFKSLVGYLQGIDIDIIFLMTPYHHNVWADEKSLTTKALVQVESLIKRLGEELNIRVLGSYNPYAVGCTVDEFYDYMHPKDKCLTKIEN